MQRIDSAMRRLSAAILLLSALRGSSLLFIYWFYAVVKSAVLICLVDELAAFQHFHRTYKMEVSVTWQSLLYFDRWIFVLCHITWRTVETRQDFTRGSMLYWIIYLFTLLSRSHIDYLLIFKCDRSVACVSHLYIYFMVRQFMWHHFNHIEAGTDKVIKFHSVCRMFCG